MTAPPAAVEPPPERDAALEREMLRCPPCGTEFPHLRAAIDAARKGKCAHTNQKPICHRLIDGIGRVVFQCQDCLAELIYEEPEDHGATLGSALREEPRT